MFTGSRLKAVALMGGSVFVISILFGPVLFAGEKTETGGQLTADESGSKISEKDKIDILFKEYDVLREEIVQRLSIRISFLGLLGALLGFTLFQARKFTRVQLYLLVGGVVVLLIVWLQLGRIISRCSVRVAEIEKKVNCLAGEELLVWETRQMNNELNILNRIFSGFKGKK